MAEQWYCIHLWLNMYVLLLVSPALAVPIHHLDLNCFLNTLLYLFQVQSYLHVVHLRTYSRYICRFLKEDQEKAAVWSISCWFSEEKRWQNSVKIASFMAFPSSVSSSLILTTLSWSRSLYSRWLTKHALVSQNEEYISIAQHYQPEEVWHHHMFLHNCHVSKTIIPTIFTSVGYLNHLFLRYMCYT